MADAANPPVEAEAPASALHDANRLARLYADLLAVIAAMNDEAAVPERWETTGRGLLADADAERLLAARSVVRRLHLWAKFPTVSPERYTR